VTGSQTDETQTGGTQADETQTGEVAAFYAAYRRWAALLARPERQLNLRLAPEDCLIFDNTRILHARTAFGRSASPGRHLQGCYADLDGLASTLAVLTRGEAP
jgi:gamma-butyrobetaine dioxygenase